MYRKLELHWIHQAEFSKFESVDQVRRLQHQYFVMRVAVTLAGVGMKEKRFQIVNTRKLDANDCPCGTAKRAFVDDPDQVASLHIVDVSEDSRTHYHKKMTEIYYVLEGSGQIELDGLRFDIERGVSVLIKPGCRHRAIGKLKLLNVPIPAFDPTDEYFDEE